MGKGIRKPAKSEKDFRKQRLKVGKTLAKPKNETSVNLKVAKLSLPQAYNGSENSNGHTSLQELGRQLKHHNSKVRRAALQQLFHVLREKDNQFIGENASKFLRDLFPCLLDEDATVRTAFISVMEVLYPYLSLQASNSYLSVLVAHIRSAASHLNTGLRSSAIECLTRLVGKCTQRMAESYMPAIFKIFIGVLPKKHQVTTLTAQAASPMAASVHSLHQILKTICCEDKDIADTTPGQTRTSQAQSWCVNKKPVRLFIRLPGILQHAANGVNVLKGKEEVKTTMDSFNQIDVVEVAHELIQNLCCCWEACCSNEQHKAGSEGQLQWMTQVIECIQMIIEQLPSSNTGSDKRHDIIMLQLQVFAVDKLVPVFPIHSRDGLKEASPSLQVTIGTLNSCIVRLILYLGPVHCSPNAAKKLSQIQQGNNNPSISIRVTDALIKLTQAATKEKEASPSSQNFQEVAASVTACGMSQVERQIQGYLDSTDDKAQPRKPVSAVQLSTALQAVSSCLSLVNDRSRIYLESVLANVFSSSLSKSKMSVLADFLYRECCQFVVGDSSLSMSTLKLYTISLVSSFTAGDDALSMNAAMKLLKCLLCLSKVKGFASQEEQLVLLGLLGQFKPLFQTTSSEQHASQWSTDVGVEILLQAGLHP